MGLKTFLGVTFAYPLFGLFAGAIGASLIGWNLIIGLLIVILVTTGIIFLSKILYFEGKLDQKGDWRMIYITVLFLVPLWLVVLLMIKKISNA